MRRLALLLTIPLMLAACSDGKLRDLRNDSNGPDEFKVKTSLNLEEPADYSALPPPTPGQGNRVDRSAVDDGIRAFGGRPAAIEGGIPASDGALVNHAGRNGVTANIRATLAEEDAKFRKRKARFTGIRIAPVDSYAEAYQRETLNAPSEARKWRRAGARTPSSPPFTRRAR